MAAMLAVSALERPGPYSDHVSGLPAGRVRNDQRRGGWNYCKAQAFASGHL